MFGIHSTVSRYCQRAGDLSQQGGRLAVQVYEIHVNRRCCGADEYDGQGSRLSGELSGLLLDESVGWQFRLSNGSAKADPTELALQIGGVHRTESYKVRLGLRKWLIKMRYFE